jgi:hypothetical protein
MQSPKATLTRFGLFCWLLLLLTHPVSAASNEKAASADAAAKGRPTIAESDLVIGSTDPGAAADQAKGNAKAAQPVRANARSISTDAKALVTTFKTSREAYLQNQKALLLQYKDATSEERRTIREQMKELLASFKDQQRSFRDDIRNRARSIREELNPSLGRAVGNGAPDDRGR